MAVKKLSTATMSGNGDMPEKTKKADSDLDLRLLIFWFHNSMVSRGCSHGLVT